MHPLAQEIKQAADNLAPKLVDIRRHLHSHPELSFKEYETAAFVKAELEAIGLVPKSIGGTGLTALIEGKHPEKQTIALRADLDALPILEQSDKPYASQNTGVMHACGHDVHTTCLLGAARILFSLRDHFEGTIKLIFQPGEEVLPGGASILIKEGVLQNPAPSHIIGQHVMPELEVGKVGFRPGLYMASTDELYFTIKGKGGHGAMPHQLADPVLMAAQLILALQQVASRWSRPDMPTVLSIGKVMADGATNVVPSEVKMEGTFRTYDEAWRKEAHRRMKEMAESLIKSQGGELEMEIRHGYPSLTNDEALTQRMIQAATAYLGAEQVVALDMRATAEDFAWYTQQIPGGFYRLGTGNAAKGITASVHNARFDIDEAALPLGAGLMAWLAVSELGVK